MGFALNNEHGWRWQEILLKLMIDTYYDTENYPLILHLWVSTYNDIIKPAELLPCLDKSDRFDAEQNIVYFLSRR